MVQRTGRENEVLLDENLVQGMFYSSQLVTADVMMMFSFPY